MSCNKSDSQLITGRPLRGPRLAARVKCPTIEGITGRFIIRIKETVKSRFKYFQVLFKYHPGTLKSGLGMQLRKGYYKGCKTATILKICNLRFFRYNTYSLYLKKRFPNPAFRGGINVFMNKNGLVSCMTIILLPM